MKKTFEISIPTDWSEISVEMYYDYMQRIKDVEDQRQIIKSTISSMCNLSEDVVDLMKLKDLKQISEGLQKLQSKPINKEIITKIVIDGKTFGFHPNLDEMTMGEFVDLEEFAKINDIPKMMSILYRPIVKEDGNRYNIEPYDSEVHIDNWHEFKNMSINIANGMMFFFWNLGIKSLKDLVQSLKEKEGNLHQVDMGGLQS